MKDNSFSPRFESYRLHYRENNLLGKSRIGRRRMLKGTVALGLAGIGLFAGPSIGKFLHLPTGGVAHAEIPYDGAAAASWADQYAITDGTDYSTQTQGGDLESNGDDCTNFVSNAMLHGGFPMDEQWYSITDSSGNWQYGSDNDHPWTVAPDLLDYLLGMNLAVVINTFTGPQRGSNPTNGLAQGDLVFFSWKNDGNYTHVVIQTVGVVDNSGNEFDQVDAHTTDRYRAFWTLEDFWQDDPGHIPNPNNVGIAAVHVLYNTAPALYLPSF